MKSRNIIILFLSLALMIVIFTRTLDGRHNFGELDILANKYGTDKGTYHHFTQIYEYFFYPIKYKAKKIFEIGIEKGASLKMWRDFFPHAVIYGIDIKDPSKLKLDSDKIKTFIADQANRNKLKDFIETYGDNFDVILDDGGHTMKQQQVSFGYLFKYVKPGGFYVIEDVHTSLYGAQWEAMTTGENTTLAMIEQYMATGIIKSDYMETNELDYLTDHIAYCNLFAGNNGNSMTCIFKKRDATP